MFKINSKKFKNRLQYRFLNFLLIFLDNIDMNNYSTLLKKNVNLHIL